MIVMQGYTLEEVLNWPLDKYYLISESVQRVTKTERLSARKIFVMDNVASITSLFSKDVSIKKYLKELEG